LVLASCLLVNIIGCHSSQSEANAIEIPFKDNAVVYTQWNDIFEQDTIIPLTFLDSSVVIYSIGGLLVVPDDGGYIISDWKSKKMIQFDSSGRFLRYLGGIGAGPGEMALGTGRGFFDKGKNLYLVDAITHRINKYTYPAYRFEKMFIMPFSSQKTILDEKGNFIIYTVSGPNVIQKIDATGKILKKAYQVNNLNFRLFSSRFQLGRLAEIPGEGFIFSYPQEYRIFYYDYEFKIKKILYSETYSRFFPKKAEFPNTLSPYDFSPAHAKWWGSALRPSTLYYLGNGLFIQCLSKFTNMDSKSFVNLHDLNGVTYAAGVEEPFENGNILLTDNGYVYAVEDSIFDENGKTTPVKLHRYKLKSSIKK
jgi:hypothetical protein